MLLSIAVLAWLQMKSRSKKFRKYRLDYIKIEVLLRANFQKETLFVYHVKRTYSTKAILKVQYQIIFELSIIFLDWSDSIYTIHRVYKSLGICYYRILDRNKEEVDRSFYENELNRVATKQ